MYSLCGLCTADGISTGCLSFDRVLAEKTGIHVKTLHQMFGPKGNPTAAHLFNVVACLQ